MIKLSPPMSRRTLLRGAGTLMALPLMEAMVGPARVQAAPVRPKRFQVLYSPNGMQMPEFTPAGAGEEYVVSKTLRPLAPHRDKFSVITNLDHAIDGKSGHAEGCAGMLSGAQIREEDWYNLAAGPTIDQIMAQKFGRDTPIASLELGIEPPSMGGSCGGRFSCAYTNTLSWRDGKTPMPVTINPRDVFERLFGDGDNVDPRNRMDQLRRDASVLDFVMEDAARVSGRLGVEDKHKMNQYMDSVRDIEMRIQKVSNSADQGMATTDFARPSGVPEGFQEHVQMMIDLQILAMQTDSTRVGTLMLGRELSSRAYPEIGVPETHHMLSHHGNQKAKTDKLQKINELHIAQVAYYLQRLAETKDGEGSLLDTTFLLAGAILSDSNTHSGRGLPIIVGGGLVKTGQHIVMPMGTTKANMLVAIMNTFGFETDRIGDSTGSATELLA